MLAQLEATLRALAGPLDDVAAVGVACAGQIDPDTGAVLYAPNLDWRDVPLGAHLAEALGTRIVVENDVRAAAWGEFRFGAGAGARSLIAVFVGTGIGSGAVLGGTLWRGATNGAGEIGHTQVVASGRPCPCGRHGCVEPYASGSGFQGRLREALAGGVATRLEALAGAEAARLTAAMVQEAAAMGDRLACELWDDAERYLAQAIANAVTLLNPEVLVLGGGVMEAAPRLFATVAARVPELTTLLARRSLRIERPRLGGWSGTVGAAALAAGDPAPPDLRPTGGSAL